jgi:uncharacterized protein YcfJ
MAAFTIPLPYTVEQEKIARRQKLADALLQANLGNHNGYTSWAQVLGQIAGAYAGKHVEDKADDEEANLNNQIRSDYTNQLGAFYKDANSGMSGQELIQKYSSNPLMQEALKPYIEGFTQKQKSDNEIKDFGSTYQYGGNVVGQRIPPKPTDPVYLGDDGQIHVNRARVAGALAAQGMIPNAPYSAPAGPEFTRGLQLPNQSPNNIQAAPAGTTQAAPGAAPTPTPTAPGIITATGPNGQKIRFNPSTAQWEPITGGPTASPSGNFQ